MDFEKKDENSIIESLTKGINQMFSYIKIDTKGNPWGYLAVTIVITSMTTMLIFKMLSVKKANVFHRIRVLMFSIAPFLFPFILFTVPIVNWIALPSYQQGKLAFSNILTEFWTTKFNVLTSNFIVTNAVIAIVFSLILLVLCLASSLLFKLIKILVFGLALCLSVWCFLKGTTEYDPGFVFLGFVFIFILGLTYWYLNQSLYPLVQGAHKGSLLVFFNILYILPIILIAALALVFELSVFIPILSSLSVTKFEVLELLLIVFFLFWSWNFLLYFVKTFSAAIFAFNNGKNKDSVFWQALKRTFAAYKYILYFSLVPAFFDFMIFVIELLIKWLKSLVRLSELPTNAYVSFCTAPLGFILSWIIIPILRTIKGIIAAIKSIFELDIELSVTELGIYSHKGAEIDIHFNYLGKALNTSALSLFKAAFFRWIFYYIPLILYGLTTFFFNSNLAFLSSIQAFFITGFTIVFTVFNITQGGPLNMIIVFCQQYGPYIVVMGGCTFVVFAILGAIFTGLVFDEIKQNGKTMKTSESENIKKIGSKESLQSVNQPNLTDRILASDLFSE